YESRPLQGQSNNVANLSLMYNDHPLALFGQLDVQYIGKTLSKVTEFYHADYYQKPQLSLAASLEKSLGRHLTIFGKFDNLLNTPSVLHTNHGLIVGRNTYGSSYSVGIRYSN
ncbi:MAG TPA: hypothetical protein VKA08_16960, partial [Balneolales bacterium]|nr:hypothetical protein [Balneolales bacterium]